MSFSGDDASVIRIRFLKAFKEVAKRRALHHRKTVGTGAPRNALIGERSNRLATDERTDEGKTRFRRRASDPHGRGAARHGRGAARVAAALLTRTGRIWPWVGCSRGTAQKRYAIPACFMMALAVKRDAQFVETVTEMVPFVQVWWEPFCLEKEKPCCLSTAITWL